MTSSLYPGVAGSPATVTTTAYIAGYNTSITVADASVLPAAPNVLSITAGTGADAVFATIRYTSVSGNTISGLTVVEGSTETRFESGSIVQRLWTAWDWQQAITTMTGGATLPKTLTSSDNLNTVTAPGVYNWASESPPVNKPSELYSGCMMVQAFGNSVVQVCYGDDRADDIIYAMRAIQGNTAGEWGYLPFYNSAYYAIDVAHGGTGAVNPSQARNNLGAAAEKHASRHAGNGADPIAVATSTVDGLESAEDKEKLDSIESRATHNPIVITGHSVSFPNIAQIGERWLSKGNGTIYKIFTKTSSAFFDSGVVAPVGWYATPDALLYYDGSAVFSEGESDYLGYALVTKKVQGHMSAEDKTKLDTVEADADVNILETVKVNGAALTPSAKAVNIPPASTTVDGVMVKADKSKLDAIAAGAQVNVLDGIQIGGVAAPITAKKSNIPPATASALGVVKVGMGLDVDTNGKLSVQQPVLQSMHGLKINWGNSNPNTNLAYSLLSTLRTPATTYNGTAARDTDYTGDWDLSWLFDDDQRYWVLLHNITSATAAGDATLVGTENYKLNPANIFQKTDGTSAVLDGTDGDLMVCRRCMWDKYLKGTGQEDELLVSPGKPSGDIGWYARAFEFEGTIRDRVYYGVCHATKDASNRLRSAINYAGNLKPLASTTIGNFETYAKNNNPAGTTGYSQWNVNMHDLMLILFWLKYGSMDSQTALGYGYCNTTTANPQPDIVGGSFREYNAADATPYVYGGAAGGYDYGIKNGVTNPAGTNCDKVHMRFDGMDDYWGNVVQWCKGVTVVSREVAGVTKHWVRRAGGNAEAPNPASWNEAAARYLETEYSANKDGYYSKVSRDPLAPLQGISFAGGATNKFVCDYGYLYAGCVAASGGHWAYGLSAGVSRLSVSYGVSSANAAIGGRLLFYPPELADM